MKKVFATYSSKDFLFGGGGGIRTLGRVTPTPDFESGTFDHSATPPDLLRFVETCILAVESPELA